MSKYKYKISHILILKYVSPWFLLIIVSKKYKPNLKHLPQAGDKKIQILKHTEKDYKLKDVIVLSRDTNAYNGIKVKHCLMHYEENVYRAHDSKLFGWFQLEGCLKLDILNNLICAEHNPFEIQSSLRRVSSNINFTNFVVNFKYEYLW